jgi:hypothetical protein
MARSRWITVHDRMQSGFSYELTAPPKEILDAAYGTIGK